MRDAHTKTHQPFDNLETDVDAVTRDLEQRIQKPIHTMSADERRALEADVERLIGLMLKMKQELRQYRGD